MKIRLATLDDQAALTAFGHRTYSETFAPDNKPDDMAEYLAMAFSVDRQRAELSDPETWTLLGEVDGKLVAYAQIRRTEVPECVTGPSPIELVRFYIDAPWHGQGLAPALMTAALEQCATQGARTIWLGVWERNHRAMRFYAKHGFVDVGSHEFVLGQDRQTDRIMSRAL
jgi:diamine N-acetyltransferase